MRIEVEVRRHEEGILVKISVIPATWRILEHGKADVHVVIAGICELNLIIDLIRESTEPGANRAQRALPGCRAVGSKNDSTVGINVGVSRGDGGNPVKPKYARRRSFSREAGPFAVSPAAWRFASRKASIGWRVDDFGGAVLPVGWKAQ